MSTPRTRSGKRPPVVGVVRPDASAAPNGGRRAPNRSLAGHVALVGFCAAVLLVAGFGFVYKMTEFALTIVKDDVEGFGAVAIAIYLIGMLPIVFLTLWAVLTGRFRDIERPKYRMLELNADLMDGPPLRREGAPRRGGRRG